MRTRRQGSAGTWTFFVDPRRLGNQPRSDSYRSSENWLISFENLKPKPVIYAFVNLIGAAWVYRLLISGGWLTHHYDLHDPDSINLVLATVEPLVVLCVIAYWIWRTRFLYRLLFISFIAQLLIGAGLLAFFGFFFLTWKPKMM